MPTIDELTIADAPETWEALGFAVEGEICRLAGVRVRLAGASTGKGLVSWSLRDIGSEQLDGLPTSRSERAVSPPAPAHPNGVLGIDHVVAFSSSFERSVEAMKDAGLDLRRVREEPTATGAPRQAFFRLGRELLELVQEPVDLAEQRGREYRTAYFWGVAMLVEDLDRTVQVMAPHAPPARGAVQPGRRISTLKRSAGLSLPVALMSREESAGGTA